tara:strand:+ start:342 stop:650 length:309 start_codon:yes stop_codon:yes gene_type:complete
MIYYVDIDDTICMYPDKREYHLAVPDQKRIDKINDLYRHGNTIVYWTARGSTSGLDWHDLTKMQLIKWGALHHDLILGKPHYDVFIDDKAITSGTYFDQDTQ